MAILSPTFHPLTEETDILLLPVRAMLVKWGDVEPGGLPYRLSIPVTMKNLLPVIKGSIINPVLFLLPFICIVKLCMNGF